MQFIYKVRNKQGSVEEGVLDTPTIDMAIDALQRNNYIIIDISEIKGAEVWYGKIFSFIHRGVPKKEIVIFSRQISTLFQAKVPLIEALKTMMEQTENKVFKMALLNIAKDVDAGSSLSKAMALHPNVFSEFYVNMVRSGEASGRLEDVFNYLADGLERDYYLNKKIQGALTYPAFIVFGFLIVVFVMMVFVVPNLTAILEETGQELPFLTRVVIAIAHAFQYYWWLIIIVMALSFSGLWYYINTPQGKFVWHKTQIHIPIFGKLLIKFYLARLTDNLSVLIKGGLPIVQALEVTSDVVGNMVYRDIMLETIEKVKKGNTISSVFKTKREIPIMVSQMVYVGEDSGRLDSTLKAAADFYQKEVAVAVDSIVTLIEPILILVLGFGVGILLVAILMPMYNMASSF